MRGMKARLFGGTRVRTKQLKAIMMKKCGWTVVITILIISLLLPKLVLVSGVTIKPRVLLVFPDIAWNNFLENPTGNEYKNLLGCIYTIQSYLILTGIPFDIKNESTLTLDVMKNYKVVIFIQKYISEAHYDTFLTELKQYIYSGGNVIYVFGATVDYLGYYNESKIYKSGIYRKEIFNIGSTLKITLKNEGIRYSFVITNNTHPITEDWNLGESISNDLDYLKGWYPSKYLVYLPTDYSIYNSSIPTWNLVGIKNETSGELLGYTCVVAKHPDEGARISILVPYIYKTDFQWIDTPYSSSMLKIFKRVVFWCLYGDSLPWISFKIAPTILISYRWDDTCSHPTTDYHLRTWDWVKKQRIPITAYVKTDGGGWEGSMINWDNLKTFYNDELVNIGSHTHSHPLLTQLNASSIHWEFNMSKTWILGNLSLSNVYGLAYPYNYHNYTVDYIASKYYEFAHGSIIVHSDYNHSEYLGEAFTYYPLIILKTTLGYGGVGYPTWTYPYEAVQELVNGFGEEIPYISWSFHEHNIWEDEEFRISSEKFIRYVRKRAWREVFDYEIVMRVKEIVENDFTITYSEDTITITLNVNLNYDYAIKIWNTDKYIKSVTIDGKQWYAFSPTNRIIILPKSCKTIIVKLSDTLPSQPYIKKASHELLSTTITDKLMIVKISAPSGVNSTTVIYTAGYGKPLSIKRLDTGTKLREVPSLSDLDKLTNCWYYDSTNKLIYVKVRHYSEATVKIIWSRYSEIWYQFRDMMNLAIVLIAVVTVVLVAVMIIRYIIRIR